MGKNNTTEGNLKSRLRHHKRSFMNCFSCCLRQNIDYRDFKRWKGNPTPEKTKKIAEVIVVNILNHYDFITTAPPSKNRNLNNYCCFKLCELISDMTGVPFIVSFNQRQQKESHGRFASLKSEKPVLVPVWDYKKKSILFIDDFITSGMTAKSCYEILREFDNHVDGLIYCEY